MLLVHETTDKNLFKILNDSRLRSSSKTKIKNFNPYNVHLVYTFYYTIPDNIKCINKLNKCCILFESSILLNHIFYTNKNHSAGNINSSIKYNYSDINIINNILDKLYKYSYRIMKKIKTLYWTLGVFQEIFTKIQPKIINAKYITIDANNTKLKKLIIEKYPHIRIVPI